MILLKILMRSIIKFILLSILWALLERMFYGDIQPRIVDDFMGIFLLWYIFKSEALFYFSY